MGRSPRARVAGRPRGAVASSLVVFAGGFTKRSPPAPNKRSGRSLALERTKWSDALEWECSRQEVLLMALRACLPAMKRANSAQEVFNLVRDALEAVGIE